MLIQKLKTLFINSKVWLGKNNFTDSIGFDSASGRILFTGNKSEAQKIKADYDEIIDTGNKLVIPSFTDGHCHFVKGAFLNSQLNLRNASVKTDFINGIMDFKLRNPGKWISGGFFTEANFKEEINLNKIFLDNICPDIPVIISRFDSHSGFANTKALENSGLLGDIEKFKPEEVIRDKNNLPTGELKERAREFVLEKIPAASPEERTDIVLKQMREFHSYGITSISDITLIEDLEIYKSLIEKGKLMIRVDARLPFSEFKNLEKYKKEFSGISELIRFKSLKAFYDGSLSSRTAYMHSNYRNENQNGIRTEFINSGDFQKMFFEIDKSGYQMSVHAIGDRAVTELLDLNEELIRINGIKDRRFRIEHAQHIAEKDFQRFKELKIIASVQPSHLFSDAKTSTEILIDYKLEHNYKKLFDLGAHVCFGTDFPIVGASPFDTIYFAMTRIAEGFEDGFVPENKISLTECLEAYTSENTYACFEENNAGKLKPGMKADIAVLENDLFEMRADEIREAKVHETYIGGVQVFG